MDITAFAYKKAMAGIMSTHKFWVPIATAICIMVISHKFASAGFLITEKLL
jgi:hypothetical protein